MAKTRNSKPNLLSRFFSTLGPGVITGAADDDPSGIATYSMAGAQLGTSLLWTALLTWPLMAAVQMMCARIGMVTGAGLAGALREKFPKFLLIVVCLALVTANTINIGADLSAMADAAELLTDLDSHVLVMVFGIGIGYATIRLPYYRIANTLKWLALSLFAYVITAFVIGPDWKKVLHDAFVPSLPHGKDAWAMLVAILGTTISPYLFFWQASQEVEEMRTERSRPRLPLKILTRGGGAELTRISIDTTVGMVFSNIIAYFIIIATASTLHALGLTQIQTAAEAAEALRPIAGDLAFLLFALGIIGTGLLAIPVLAGSAAYAVAEVFGWPSTLEAKFPEAIGFYTIISAATLIGFAMSFLPINPIELLVWTAVINGRSYHGDDDVNRDQSSGHGPISGAAVACLGWLGGNSSDGHHRRGIAMVTAALSSMTS